MFRKVLIANRGEIAVRILRACREFGVRTVAVYSDADRRALHVRYADEAYPIGPAVAQKSYLDIDTILDVARKSGADAIHPGYGFLAENPQLAAACGEAGGKRGITFIGPPESAIEAMGDKVTARRLMQKAGVPVIPGTETDLRDDEILAQAKEIGPPLFVKAAAGGGGKGMRLVHDLADLERALGAARREASNAFGDERVYLERAIQGARHVEIQVLADTHGAVIHLGERECSIQRRHQKLIEESPSPALDAALREKMGQVAAQAALAVGYVNAGTVEFLLGPDGDFYFLEMNTRLQVEHPVTEAVTGVDLVKEQLRIASGESLSIGQRDVRQNGWAIECRITAEDPFNGFLPSSGRIIRIFQPSGPGVRIDSGIFEGYEASLYYDPLLSKLIVWGTSRNEAIQRMKGALREYRIVGIPTSLPFHQWALGTKAFADGVYSTSFMDDHYDLRSPEGGGHDQIAAIVATLLTQDARRSRSGPPSPCDPGADERPGGLQEMVPQAWRLAGRWEAMGR